MEVKKRILVVDNKSLDMALVASGLKSDGFYFRFAFSKRQALNLLKKQPDIYDAVVVDKSKDNSLDLLAKIKSSPNLCNIPVIIETSIENTEAYLASLKAGAFDFLYKPLKENILVSVIKNAVTCMDNS